MCTEPWYVGSMENWIPTQSSATVLPEQASALRETCCRLSTAYPMATVCREIIDTAGTVSATILGRPHYRVVEQTRFTRDLTKLWVPQTDGSKRYPSTTSVIHSPRYFTTGFRGWVFGEPALLMASFTLAFLLFQY